MLVCRHWRALAVSNPRLWQTIYIKKRPEWLETSVLRSGNIPLDITLKGGEAYMVHPIYEQILSHSLPILSSVQHRLRRFRIFPLSPPGYNNALKLLKGNLPALEQLSLAVLARVGFGSRLTSLGFSLSQLPSLRDLCLEHLCVTWEPSVGASLRRLVLRDCVLKSSTTGKLFHTLDEMVDVLDSCRSLEELKLHGVLASIPTNTISEPSRRKTCFPKLRKFVIWDNAPTISLLLSHLQLPVTAQVRLASYVTMYQREVRNLSHILSSFLPQDRTGLPHLRAATEARVSFVRMDSKIQAWCGDTKLTLKIRTTGTYLTDYLQRALGELRDVFSEAPLEHLTISGDFSTVQDTMPWVETFTAFPTLETMYVDGYGPPLTLVSALAHTISKPTQDPLGSDDGQAQMVVCPNLREVQMTDLSWQPGFIEAVITTLRRRGTVLGRPGLEKFDMNAFVDDDQQAEFDETMELYRDELASLIPRVEIRKV